MTTNVRTTSELRPSDRVILPSGAARTVLEVQETSNTDPRGTNLHMVRWCDVTTAMYAPADYRWDLAPMTVAQLRSALFKLEDQDAPALEALESILSTDDILALHNMVVLNA
jgi:hypothetical protein